MLPVECPIFSVTVRVDPFTGIYIFTEPNFGPTNVTVLDDIMYFPHGGQYTVNFSITNGQNLTSGSYELTTMISDTELTNNCVSMFEIIGMNIQYFVLIILLLLQACNDVCDVALFCLLAP